MDLDDLEDEVSIISSKNEDDQQKKASASSSKKSSKKLPWNSEILKDRFTSQPFQIQLVELCMSASEGNLLVFMKSKEWKNYLKITLIKQFALLQAAAERKQLMILVTNMGSDVSSYVELLSRHTTLRLAGIESVVATNSTTPQQQLKRDAHILIMSISLLVDWFKLGLVQEDEIAVVMFDEVCGAFYNENYRTLVENYLISNSPKIVGLGTLDINRSTTHTHIRQSLDYLKGLFRCDLVETATDLLDTHNIFNGNEPRECIYVCEDTSSTEFHQKLINLIKNAYVFLEDLNASKSLNAYNLNSSNTTTTSNGLFNGLEMVFIF